ncbi:NUDIX hydrolase [soil metagenome]
MRRVEYKYCPLCATPLEERTIYRQQRLVCPACHFVHFTDPKVAVIALVTHGDRVLLARRAVNPAKGQWALPGGYMDAGEIPEVALQRELHEELSLDIQVVQLLDVFPMVVMPGRNQGIVLAYHAMPADAQRIEFVCDDDVCEAGWFTADQLPSELAFDSTLALLERWRTDKL